MANIYSNEKDLFGPVETPCLPENINSLPKDKQAKYKKEFKNSTSLITRGKNRIIEKTKDIRQKFSKAVVNGSRSGSGKIVFEYYDMLKTIWGGSANTKPLPFGFSNLAESDDSDEGSDLCGVDDETRSRGSVGDNSNNIEENETSNNSTINNSGSRIPDNDDNEEDFEDQNNLQTPRVNKRNGSAIPKLIDSKRKHLEKNLSASQRDQLFMKEMKNESEFRHEMADAMRESNKSFSESIKEISKSMTELSKGFCNSMEMLSRTICNLQQPPQGQFPLHQNHFYQNIYGYNQPQSSQRECYYDLINSEFNNADFNHEQANLKIN